MEEEGHPSCYVKLTKDQDNPGKDIRPGELKQPVHVPQALLDESKLRRIREREEEVKKEEEEEEEKEKEEEKKKKEEGEGEEGGRGRRRRRAPSPSSPPSYPPPLLLLLLFFFFLPFNFPLSSPLIPFFELNWLRMPFWS
ncbi:hypothetical protein ZWY2020_003399 [Hordeum vulgare]|nr:hypothetical protein ZWY2020_003399 [Hordeum vulgare]